MPFFFPVLFREPTLAPLARLLKFTDPKKPESLYSVELYSLKASDIDIFDIYIEDHSGSIGQKISALHLDKDTLISSIVRGGKIIFPKGDTVIQKDDILYVLAHSAKIKEITDKLNEPAQ
ncbi:TrkA C-terminal domain-containing protein [Treponema vincentii]|uniref:TrkA C-terminal domain-containing protein n=1 Tax=Treponema vincentii TaxID=69710 RepID=UPI001E2FFF34|nr:TrkA C-terminal domain-containing protein [Treponema vincentii]